MLHWACVQQALSGRRKAVDTLRQLISGPKWKPCMQSGDMYALKRDKQACVTAISCITIDLKCAWPCTFVAA